MDVKVSWVRRAHVETASILAGGIVLIWPAFANGYPLMFDTGAFLSQLLRPFMVWDKPWIYGPAIVVLSLKLSLWVPALAQGVLLSAVLWRVRGVFLAPSLSWHLALCAVLAAGSAAPWFAALLMPDILAPVTVLALFLLAFGSAERPGWPLIALTSFAIAAHLAHILIAVACLGLILLIRPRGLRYAVLPLGIAIAVLMTTNLAGHRRLGVSPFGSVFTLARLTADGPARLYLAEICPNATYRLCAWAGRLPTDANVFLWDPNGPVWTYPGGPIGLAPEASRIVTATILSHPGAVARDALANSLEQLVTIRLNSVLGDNYLDVTAGAALRADYPDAEVARFEASVQRRDGLRAIAAPWLSVHAALLVLGCAGSLAVLVRSRRRDPRLFALTALIGAGLLSNAFATGALSGPHDRYQARIAWLVLVPPALWAMRRHDDKKAEK